MTTIIGRASAWMGFAVVALAPASARAQESADSVDQVSAQSPYAPGQGLSVSEELRLHPRLSLEGGFQTNVFFANPDDEGGEQGSPLLRVGVGASLENARPDAAPGQFVLTGDAQLTWNQFLSGTDVISKRSDLGVAATIDAKFNPEGAVNFTLRDTFTRLVNPPPAEFAEDADRDKNKLSARLGVKPGGGAIEIYGETSWTLDIFESETFKFANRNSFELKAGSKWQWLPKTQLFGEASLGLVLVEDNSIRTDTSSPMPLRISIGASTLVTSNFGTVLRIGYGNSFQDGGFNSYIAQAEARYAFGPMFKVAGGYSRDFADTVIGNFRDDHTLFARFAARLQGQLQVLGKAEARFRSYAGIPMMAQGFTFCGNAACTTADRSDFVLRFTLEAQYEINAWLQAGAAFTRYSVDTDAFVTGGRPVPDSFAFAWSEFVASLRARL